MSDTIEAYPLCWPVGRPRTPAGAREQARFGSLSKTKSLTGDWTNVRRVSLTLAQGRDRLLHELSLFNAQRIVISTNVELRQDGLPYSNRRSPDDPGVAVYFRLNNQPRVITCDGWDTVADNLAAIAATVDAKRGEMRWKTGTADQAFAGFLALSPLPPKTPWHRILGFRDDEKVTTDMIEAKRRALLEQHHPDRGGDGNVAAEVNAAADEGLSSTGR